MGCIINISNFNKYLGKNIGKKCGDKYTDITKISFTWKINNIPKQYIIQLNESEN